MRYKGDFIFIILNGKVNLGQEKIEKILDFLNIKLVITK